MSEFTLTLDGRAEGTEQTFGVVNPATGKVFAECPDASPAQLDEAMESAQRAFRSWCEDESARRNALRACAEKIRANATRIAEVLTREQGKPLEKAKGEVAGAAVWFDVTAGLEIPQEVVQDDDAARIEVHRRPLGVVGAITPWNYPVILAVWKIAPALLAGNTLVLKPSPFTPLSSLVLGDVLREVLPPGVLNVISGGDDLGKRVVEHPLVRKISFTGSVPTGKKIQAAAAPDLKRVTLELGGNDPAIVLPDVDPKQVAEKLFWGAFENSGQICVAIKRLFAHERVYEPLVEELARLAREVKLGDGLEPDTQLGPINNRPQLERVAELVKEAKDAGAEFVAGGDRLDRDGFFFAPTVVTGIAEGTRLVDEEQFGPALPVMKFSDVDEAIERANGTHYGLGGSIWTRDLDRGIELAAKLDCGTGWVNQHTALGPGAPFGGHKWSGIGVENGPWGLMAFTEIQVINAAKS